jgi:hypothetical protein
MKTQISISLAMDAIFQQTCQELGLFPYCIEEGVDSNTYELHYQITNDLYYLGIQMGLKKSQEIYTKELNK